tara:strand:+ start:423 stop:626 length:204 start_codon:yes stop_codon:yes gene_type:complete
MNKQTKSIIIGGLFGGIVYAGIMAEFDYSDGQGFRIWKFLWSFFFFGGFMSFLTHYNLKKQSKNEKK